MHIQHGRIPGCGEQREQQHTRKGHPLLPIVPPPACPGEVQRCRDKRHGEPDRSLRQRGEGHPDIEHPHPSAYEAVVKKIKTLSVSAMRPSPRISRLSKSIKPPKSATVRLRWCTRNR